MRTDAGMRSRSGATKSSRAAFPWSPARSRSTSRSNVLGIGCAGTPQIEPQVAHHQKITSGVTLIADTSALPHFLHGGETVAGGFDIKTGTHRKIHSLGAASGIPVHNKSQG